MIPTKKLKFDEDVLDVLRVTSFGVRGGLFVGLLPVALERKLYVRVNKAFEAMGGQWNRKENAHVFPSDPRPLVEGLLDNGNLTVERDGFVETPLPVISRMLDLVHPDFEEGMSYLEPSAGRGAIADVLYERGVPIGDIRLIEINQERASFLGSKGYDTEWRDFLECREAGWNRVYMNPPFENEQDIDHVRHAYRLLAEDGQMVSVMSEHAFFAKDKKATAFRAWLKEVGGHSEKLPEGSFKGISARLISIKKQIAEEEKPKQKEITGKGMNIKTAELKHALSTVGGAVPGKSTMPVLSNVYISEQDGRLRAVATDLVIGIMTSVTIDSGKGDLDITVPYKLTRDLLNSLSGQDLEIEFDKKHSSIKVKSNTSKSTLKGIDAKEFPPILNINLPGRVLTVDAEDLLLGLRKAMLAVNDQGTGNVLEGIHFKSDGEYLVIESVENTRLSRRQVRMINSPVDPVDAVVPVAFANTVAHLFRTDKVDLTFYPNKVVAVNDWTTIVTQTIEGKYPVIDPMIPTKFEHEIEVNREAFLDVVDRARLFTGESGYFALNIDADSMKVSAEEAERGDFEEVLPVIKGIVIEGLGFQIGFNVNVVKDALAYASGETVSMAFNGTLLPCLFTDIDDPDWTHVIMPMRLG